MRPITPSHHSRVSGLPAALVLSGALAGCSSGQAAAPPAHAAAPLVVKTAQVTVTDVATAIDSGGVVQARTTATIASRILAPVRAIRVWPGDMVRKGQTLIVLDGADLAAGARAARAAAEAADEGLHAASADAQAAEAGLVLARASHARVAALHAKRSATAQELDDATATLRSAEARVSGAAARASQAASAVESARAAGDQAGTLASFATITAPFDGMVTEKMVEPGNLASPGMPLLRVEDTRGFRLEVRVDESRIGQIRHGDAVPVLLGTATVPLMGTVTEVSRAVDADARASLVKIALPDTPGLRSGAFGKARFGGTPRRTLTVPSLAVVRHGQVTTVFVVEEGVAHVRLVNLNGSEVLAGLTESELVILSPPAGVTDGRRVRVGGE